MKKILNALIIAILIPTIFVSNANAQETIYHYPDGTSSTTPPTPTQAAVGGFAVVNPETGVVHGVITGNIEHFNNNKTMGHEYMGCPAGCLIIQQSTSDQNGNVAGVAGPNVTYNQDRNVFQSVQTNTVQSQTITEFASNSLAIETDINIFHSVQVYEFGVQDFTNSNGQFQMNEVAPPQNTSAQVSATTKEYACEESAILCSSSRSALSNTLINESVFFNERSTAVQVETKIIAEAKNKIREQISLILTMLERWILN